MAPSTCSSTTTTGIKRSRSPTRSPPPAVEHSPTVTRPAASLAILRIPPPRYRGRTGTPRRQGMAEATPDEVLPHHGETYTLTGPRSLTFDEVAGQLSLALGRSITYLPVSDDAKRKTLLGHGV